MKQLRIALVALVALAFSLAAAQSTEVIKVEISEDMNLFAFDQSKTHEDGMPAHGSGFVTKGFVYPAGTLNGSNGVLADGSPEFPEAVIGEWLCYGYMINDAGHAKGGAWVVSTQVINLSDDLGSQTIVTTGYEFADDSVAYRAISGGTGDYAEARGQAKQVMTGLNASEGVVLSVELEVALPETRLSELKPMPGSSYGHAYQPAERVGESAAQWRDSANWYAQDLQRTLAQESYR